MILDIGADGQISGIVGSFTDGTGLEIDPGSLGSFESERQGIITQDQTGRWFADMHLSGINAILGPRNTRAEIIADEIAWLLRNVL